MRLYWSEKSVPELAALEPAERRLVWRGAFLRCHRHWRVWLAYMAMAAYALLCWAIGMYLVLSLTNSWITLLLPAVALGGAWFVSTPLIINAALPHVRELVSGRCRSCGYDLTGNRSGTCPECGTPTSPGS
jgi:hypothetical protein